jgi:Pyridoxamine 5'-phosphate oxidase
MEQPTQDMVLEELSLTECLALLTSHRVGRVAVVVDGQPVILPVNYRTDDGTVVFRTDAGTKARGRPCHGWRSRSTISTKPAMWDGVSSSKAWAKTLPTPSTPAPRNFASCR